MRALVQLLAVLACFAWVVVFERVFARMLRRTRLGDAPVAQPVPPMTAVVLAVLVAAVFVYLLAAVLRPERF